MTTTISMNGNGQAVPAFLAIPELSEEDMEDRDNTAALRRKGLIRVQGVIPIKLNDRIKAMARAQGRNADQLMGDLIQQCTADVDRWEAEQEVARLRERFGDDWLDTLRRADPTQQG